MELEINARNQTLRDVLANGRQYRVPKFQRDYSWEKPQWEDLWEDIQLLTTGKETYHYMGYLVIQPDSDNDPNKPSMIIDGQQRLTTLSLLILAAISRVKEVEQDTARADELHKNFIGSKDLVTLQTTNKLTLNRNNDFFYKQAVEGKPLPQRGKKNTVHLMRQAIEFFRDKFGEVKTGQDIGRMIETISTKLLFTMIYIGNHLNAYKVFETLNARGVQLSSSDLLKNYIFSLIAENQDIPDTVIDVLDEKWDKIGADIGARTYTEYILTEWNSRHQHVRKSELFKKISTSVKTAQEANAYLDNLVVKSEVYSALRDPNADFWKDHSDYIDIKNDLRFLELFKVKQPISLLLIAYQKQPKHFPTILKWVRIFSIRYNIICRFSPNEQERTYNNICLAINKGCALKDIKAKINTLYPNDEKFRQSFIDKTMPTEQSNKKVRYLLAELEEHASKPKKPIDPERLTVEHILPLSPNDQWVADFGDNENVFKRRIGNMTLVDASTNKQLGQQPFAEKREILLKTPFHISKNLKSYEQWDSGAVESRQKQLADLAVELWRIN